MYLQTERNPQNLTTPKLNDYRGLGVIFHQKTLTGEGKKRLFRGKIFCHNKIIF